MSKGKTCGVCKYFYDYENRCYPCVWCKPTDDACVEFEPQPITNGDVIRHGGDDALIDFADGIRRRMCHYCVYSKDKSCVDKTGDCWEGIRAWLNAPADAPDTNVGTKESEGKDE